MCPLWNGVESVHFQKKMSERGLIMMLFVEKVLASRFINELRMLLFQVSFCVGMEVGFICAVPHFHLFWMMISDQHLTSI